MLRLFAMYAAAAAAALFGAIGFGLDGAVAPPAQVELTVDAVGRCPRCGWIESKREIVPGVADLHSPKTYEYTLRMADGSSTVFEEALPASWRVGERLTVVGVARPLD